MSSWFWSRSPGEVRLPPFFFSSRRRHTSCLSDWSSDVCSSDLPDDVTVEVAFERFIAAFNALDWETFRASFAADASLFNPEIPDVKTLGRIDGRADVEDRKSVV